MEESLGVEEIKSRVKRSFLGLLGRKILLRVIGFVTINVILARVLPLETLGIFNIATAIITFFAFFSDIGLAGSLIQKRENVSREDIATTFTVQQLLVGSLTVVIFFAAPLLANYYGLSYDGIWLIRALALAFLLSSLKVVPAVMLERNLKFGPIITTEILETVVFNGLLIYLVFSDFSLTSFSIAAVARGIVGTLTIYLLSPVKIGLGITKSSLRELSNFGIPFQLNNLLALLKDKLVPLVIARMVGSEQFTYITWSQAMAYLPLDILGEINRLTFPAFSRLQNDKSSLSSAIEKTLFVTAVIIFPLLFGLGAILPSLVNYVVTTKFAPALTSFYLFAFAAYLAVISTVFTNVLNSIGKVKTTMKLMVMWTLMTWVLTPALVYFYGFIGVGVAAFIISFSSVITIILVRRVLSVRVFGSVFIPTISSMLMAVVVYFYSQYLVRDQMTLVSAIVLGGLLYLALIMLFAKDRILNSLKGLRND